MDPVVYALYYDSIATLICTHSCLPLYNNLHGRHTELRLAENATIAAVSTLAREQYPAVAPFPSYGVCNDGGCGKGEGAAPAWCNARTAALISAFGAVNVAITGAGEDSSIIDGRGCWWWAQFLAKQLTMCRPQLVNFVSSSSIEVTGVTLKDPPFWNLHIWNSSNAHVSMLAHLCARG